MLFTKMFQFVMFTVGKYSIDESHGLSHSMNALYYAHQIYKSEIRKEPQLRDQEQLIYTAAILHDMCDKKYMEETDGVAAIEQFLGQSLPVEEVDAAKSIVTTMSYSKVKKYGFPALGKYQHAYNVVREADLLTAYNFDRAMIYHMYSHRVPASRTIDSFEPFPEQIPPTQNIYTAFENSRKLFETRVFKHVDDGLFTTEYAMAESRLLHDQAQQRIRVWRHLLYK